MSSTSSLQRWRRDDWVIPCVVQDATGTPVNLTGFILGAELYISGQEVFQALNVGNGGIVRVSDPNGQFRVVAPRSLTAQAPASVLVPKPDDRTRVLLFWIDTNGKRQTFGVIPFDVFDGSESLPINEVPSLTLVSTSASYQIVVPTQQGAAGPSSIAAAQITDGGDTGRSILRAQDAATARAALQVTAIGRVQVQDVNYSVKATDTYVGVAPLTAARTITLPLAELYPPGQPLYIADESGNCGTDKPLNIAAAGQDSIAGQTSVQMASPYQKFTLHSNGTNLWTLA